MTCPSRRLAGQLQRAQRRARIAARAGRQQLDRLFLHLRLAALAPLQRPAQQREHIRLGQLAQLIQPRARQQRAVDLERWVLGRGADQGHEPFLDRRQQCVLLGLVEAVDLVEEEDRVALAEPAFACARQHRAHLGAAGFDCAQLLEGGVGAGGDDRASVVLPLPGGPCRIIECGRALLDRGAQRRAGAEQVLLTDELLQAGGAHAGGQRRVP